MRLRFAYSSLLAAVVPLFPGCMTRFSKKMPNGFTAPDVLSENATSAEMTPLAIGLGTVVPDTIGFETSSDVPVYREEEATLSAILNLYEEAVEAIDNNDYSLAESRKD